MEGYAGPLRFQKFLWIPFHRPLRLIPFLIKLLMEIPFSMKKCHSHHRYGQISCGSQGVTGQHAQAATIRGYGGIKANFHGEIGYCVRIPLYFVRQLRKDHLSQKWRFSPKSPFRSEKISISSIFLLECPPL